jgi:type IV secretory pathway VirB10-like protein
MRNLKPQIFLLALLLGLSAFGCGRETEETDSDRSDQITDVQEQANPDALVNGDPEIQPEQRVVVVEPETGEDPGAQLDEREQELAERRAELDAREQRIREQELNQRQARAPQPEPEPRVEPEEPVATGDVAEVSDQEAEIEPEPEPEEQIEPAAPLIVSIPAGTVMEVELLKGLSSQTSEPGDIFRARVASDVSTDGAVGIPAGSEVVGVVTEAVPLRKVGGQAKLTLKFTDLVLPSGKTVPIQASLAQQGRSETRKDAATIGGAAAGGAILGRVLNKKDRGKGAVIGAIIGAAAGAAIASRTPGEEVVIPEGTRLGLKLDDGIEVRPRR